MTAYWTTLGLSGPPCSKEVEDPDLWLPPSKQRLVDDLEEALREKSQVLLVGEPGVGKTCVLRALRTRLNQPNMRLTYCHNATLGRRDFYRQLCLAIGLTPNATAAAVFHGVTTHVQELGRERVYPVFLLDEAHLLHQDTLDHLHILLNYEWDRAALLSLVLVGLPELRDRLQLRRNRSLLSRIHARFTIEPTTPDDTADYLRSRLAKVGCEHELFADEAIAMLHEAAVGSMRDIDRLATGALKEIVKRKKKLVDRETIARVIDQDRLAIE